MASSNPPPPHIALFPSAGMGHLTPFLRLASMLLSRNCCMVTLITPKSTISSAESNHLSFFLSTHPQIIHLVFDTLPPAAASSTPSNTDPFFVQYDVVSRSAHLLQPLLISVTPPLSAIFCDLLVAQSVSTISNHLCIPYYAVITTSAKFFCFMVHLPVLVSSRFSKSDVVEIPGLATPLPLTDIPLPFLDPSHLLGAAIVRNIGALHKAKGILLNTFEWFEAETLAALNKGKVLSNLPPVLSVGPLTTNYELKEGQTQCVEWLNSQPAESVVYVSFGSRTAMSNDQIRELRNGLERSGCRFLWVVKTSKVDKEDKGDIKNLLGDSFMERTKNKGIVVKGWVKQQEILEHPAIAGFVSHCGWNSVVEAAQRGVPILAWPQHGDQRVNAEVAEKAGLGIWEKSWGLGGQQLVEEKDIASKVVQLIEDTVLRRKAKHVGEEARKATESGGGSEEALMTVIRQIM